MKRFGLSSLSEGISKQPSIDSAMSLLVLTLMKIYNEEDQAEKVKLQNVQFEEESSTGS